MSINDETPEDTVKPEHLDSYWKHHKDIWQRLTRVHTTTIILRHIEEFPFRLIIPTGKNVFWNTVRWNFVDTVIILIHGLVSDTGPDTLTLSRFKNLLVKDWVRPEFKDALCQRLKGARFSEKVKEIQNRVRDIRNNIVAHSIDTDKRPTIDGVKPSQMDEYFNEMKALFDACSFGSYYETRLIPYMGGTVGGKPVRTDIEGLLDLIAKNSDFVNQPERDPCWPVTRGLVRDEDLKVMNEFRKRFGLAEA